MTERRTLIPKRSVLVLFAALSVFVLASCLPTASTEDPDKPSITLYGFSIMKESLEKEIIPAFQAKWKREHGQDINFATSFAGSETITNTILQGAPADVAILSIDRDAQRLKAGGATTVDWHQYPNQGIVNRTPFVIMVRKGNPKGIRDFADLGRPGVQLIHPDPVSSGGAQWSLLAIYGSELRKSQAETGTQDPVRATNTLKAIWKNVVSSPGSAREARTTFDGGFGDALVTYELDALLAKKEGKPIEIVVPHSTIFSEHPVVLLDRNMTAAKRPIVEAFINYLWSDEAQKAFVKFHFRSVTDSAFDDDNKDFAKIADPFGVDMFGGWDKAFPDVIEHVFRDQVQGKK
jgi:sulfate/thiosulfate-binding protein